MIPIGLHGIAPDRLEEARSRGQRIRLVARCERTTEGLRAQVGPEAVDIHAPLGAVRRAENCVVLRRGTDTTVLRGQGAGRWPTATSVLADLLDLQREVC